MRDEPVVTNAAEHHRYEVRVDGELAGIAQYRVAGDRIVLTHTEIDPKFEGHGLGGRLAKAVLDDIRAQGRHVVAQCPFMAEYISRHPGYADLTEGP